MSPLGSCRRRTHLITAVGTIRVWIGLFQAFGLMSLQDSFGVAFWLSFVLHALLAEAYLWRRPSAHGAAADRPAATPESGSG